MEKSSLAKVNGRRVSRSSSPASEASYSDFQSDFGPERPRRRRLAEDHDDKQMAEFDSESDGYDPGIPGLRRAQVEEEQAGQTRKRKKKPKYKYKANDKRVKVLFNGQWHTTERQHPDGLGVFEAREFRQRLKAEHRAAQRPPVPRAPAAQQRLTQPAMPREDLRAHGPPPAAAAGAARHRLTQPAVPREDLRAHGPPVAGLLSASGALHRLRRDADLHREDFRAHGPPGRSE